MMKEVFTSWLQVSLSRMVIDIMKFTFLYLLVLFAFSCGMNQLLWYYADLEKQACMEDLRAHTNNQTTMHAVSGRKSNKVRARSVRVLMSWFVLQMAYERDDRITIEINHCLAYRKFAKLVEIEFNVIKSENVNKLSVSGRLRRPCSGPLSA